MESFFSTLKTECIDEKIYLSRTPAKREIFEYEYIEIDYHRKRRHSSIGSMTPENFENQSKVAYLGVYFSGESSL
jgi:putative transposase